MVNPATVLATLVIDELVHQGVREVVLCPGSRSAPLAFVVAAAERAGRLRLHVRIDERSAGFLALGLAKASGLPVPVITTSGSAVANLTPAVVEASYAGVPLVALTADRPFEARGIGSPQTIDQADFFGSNVRYCADLGQERKQKRERVGSSDADDHDQQQDAQQWNGQQEDGQLDRQVRNAVVAGVAAALGVAPSGAAPASPLRPGPVQFNVGFRMPVVPDAEDLSAGLQVASPQHPRHPRRPPLPHCGCRDLGGFIGPVPTRGVMVLGDLPAPLIRGHQQWLARLACDLGWPILAEPTANVADAPTAIKHGVLIAGEPNFRAEHVPDLVITAGSFGLSRATMELVRRAGRHVAIDLGTSREVCNPTRTAEQVLDIIPMAPEGFCPDVRWLADWQQAEAVVAEVLRGRVGIHGAEFTGIDAAVTTAEAVSHDGLMLVAASWPVRHLEAFARVPAGVRVIGNRGANGIDGLVSTAWGAALAHQAQGGGPALALLGDLALLHDHNGLLAPAGEPEPDLTLVVVDNHGGGVFHQLEQGKPQFAADFERLFGTPPGVDLAAVCAAAGRPTLVANSASELSALLQQRPNGVQVVVARVASRRVEAEKLRALSQATHVALEESRLRAHKLAGSSEVLTRAEAQR